MGDNTRRNCFRFILGCQNVGAKARILYIISDISDMPVEKDGLLFIHHNALASPLKVCSLWLRDHCRCINCYGETFQRKFNLAEIPMDVKPTELKTENNFILVTCELTIWHLSSFYFSFHFILFLPQF